MSSQGFQVGSTMMAGAHMKVTNRIVIISPRVERSFRIRRKRRNEVFKRELTSPRPADRNIKQQFTWHRKVNHPVMRFHFSGPVRRRELVYLVYVGPKLTKG